MTPTETTDAAATLAARLPMLALAREAYRHIDLPADTTFQLATLVLELLRRVEALESRERERDGGK